MATVIEWRRVPNADPHTGSVEANGVPGRPFVYVHPQDMAAQTFGGTKSFEADWRYTQDDAAKLTVDGGTIHVEIDGVVSYDRYQALRSQYQSAGWLNRFLWWAGATFLSSTNPTKVYGGPLATSLQPSGELAYDAYLRIEPPEPSDSQVDIEVLLEVSANMGISSNAAGTNFTDSMAKALNGALEIAVLSASSGFVRPADTSNQRVAYAVTVPAGGEVKVAHAKAGLAFTIKKGTSVFFAYSDVIINA